MNWYERFYTNDFTHLVGFASPEQTRKEATFIQEALGLPSGSAVLDLCCGYGRLTGALSEITGWRMTGLDLSKDYLDVARKEASGKKIDYILGDMRDIPFENQFEATINMFTSFGYFETDEENESVLKQVHKCLQPHGLFLLDCENRIHFIRNDVLKKRRDWRILEEGKCVLLENDYDVIREREIFKATMFENGKAGETTGYSIRLFSFPELNRMLAGNGFRILDVWGDYDKRLYSVESSRFIILSQKS